MNAQVFIQMHGNNIYIIAKPPPLSSPAAALVGTVRVFIENSFGRVYYFFTRRYPTKKHIALCSMGLYIYV